jgi:hypothetical protein
MKIEIPISVGDFIDRLSILEIKKENKLNVEKELEIYYNISKNLDPQGFTYFKNIIKSINLSLWDIEYKKRQKSVRYTNEYSDLSTLTTQLNDLRHETKKRIDSFFNSDIVELKKHEE